MLSIFGSKHVKNSVRAVNAIASENSGLLASNYVASRANEILKVERRKTECSIDEDGLSYRGLAFLVIGNVIFNELSSGKHHIFRGTLNMIGKSMRQFWPVVCKGMIEEGLSDEESISVETKDLDASIQSAG